MKMRSALELGACILIGLLPWQARYLVDVPTLADHPWEYGTVAIYAWDALFVVLAVVSIVTKSVRPPAIQKHGILLSLTALVTLTLLSVFVADERGAALTGAVLWVEGLFAFLLITGLSIRWERIALALAFSAGIQGVWAVHQLLMQSIPADTWLGMAAQDPGALGTSVIQTEGLRSLRAYGSLPHPNMLGGFLTIGWLAGAALLLQKHIWRTPRQLRILVHLSMALSLIGLVLTFSRSAWLGLVVSVVLAGAAILWRARSALPRFITMVLMAVIAGGVAAAFVPQLIAARLDGSAVLTAFSDEQRATSSETARTLLGDEWIMGVGVRNETSAARALTTDTSHAIEPVHSVPLLIFVELGIAGLLVFLWVVREFFKVETAAFLRFRGVPGPFILTSAAWIAIIVIGFYDHYPWTLHGGVLLWWMTTALWWQSLEARA